MAKATVNYRRLFVYLLSANAACGYAYWSYNLSIFNSLQIYLQTYIFPDASTQIISLVASFLSLGAIFGALLAIPMMNKWNRRKTMLIADVFGIIGLILTVIATLPTMLIGRIISGAVGGINTVVIPVYLVEMSPLQMCGATGSLSIITLETSAFVSLAMSFAVPEAPDGTVKDQIWRILFLIPILLNIARFLCLMFFFKHETPFVHILNNKEGKANESLAAIFKNNVEVEYKRVKNDVVASSLEGIVRLRDLFTRKYRRSFFIGFLVAVMQQMCGMTAVFVFSNDILARSVEDPALLSTILGIINLAAVIISFGIIEKFGRRFLLITGTLAMGILWLVFGLLAGIEGESHPALKILLLIWPCLFQMSLGSLTFLYISEILPSVGVAFCITANWTAGFLITQFYLSVVEHLGFSTPFFFFSACCLATGSIFWRWMVETKGRTKSEILQNYAGIVTTYAPEPSDQSRWKAGADEKALRPAEEMHTESPRRELEIIRKVDALKDEVES